MTKEEAIDELDELRKSNWTDRGMVHACADDTLLEYLESINAEDLVTAWRKVCRE